MTTPTPSAEADLILILRQQAAEIAQEGHCGWGNTMLAAADLLQSLQAQSQWVSVSFEHWELPAIGQPVLLCIGGVVQNETFTLDQGDDGFGGGEYFWSRDDLDECPAVAEGQSWMPLPSPPTGASQS